MNKSTVIYWNLDISTDSVTLTKREQTKNEILKTILIEPRININNLGNQSNFINLNTKYITNEFNLEYENYELNKTKCKLNNSIIIKSNMGTGKTKCIVDFMNKYEFKSILYISTWITFSNYLFGMLNRDTKYKFSLYNEPYVDTENGNIYNTINIH